MTENKNPPMIFTLRDTCEVRLPRVVPIVLLLFIIIVLRLMCRTARRNSHGFIAVYQRQFFIIFATSRRGKDKEAGVNGLDVE